MTVVIDPRHQRAVVFALDRLGPGLAGLAEQLRAGGVRVGGYSTRGNGAAARDDVVDCRVARPGLSDSAALNEVTRQLDIPVERCAVVDASRDGLAAARDAGFAVVIGVGDTLTLQDADMVVADTAEIVIRAFDGRMSTLPDALRCIELIGGVVAGHPCAVFFDFDGTLSEIVDDPASATLIDGAAEALASLAEVCPVAVLSGRSLPDVQSRVGVAGIWYAGSHGFEVCGPDGHVEHDPAALTAVPVLRRVADELRRELSGVPGVAVEDKRFAVAIHYRGVNPDRVGVVGTAPSLVDS